MRAVTRLSRWIRMALHTLAVAAACTGVTACKGGGGSPNSPSGSGGGGSTSSPSCRTAAGISHSVQTFTATGQTVTSDTTCAHNTATNDVVCNSTVVDSVGGSGTLTQTSRFSSRADIVDEVAVNPPLARSLGTTTVTVLGGVSLTTTATNTYDSQQRLTSTQTVTPIPVVGQITTTMTFNAWDTSGRPTGGSITLSPGGTNPISYTYDATNRTATRNLGLNTCTVTYDPNGNITREVCTGTQPSTTTVTINSTQQICK